MGDAEEKGNNTEGEIFVQVKESDLGLMIICNDESSYPNTRLIFAFSLAAPVPGKPGKYFTTHHLCPPISSLSALCTLSGGTLEAPRTKVEPGKRSCAHKKPCTPFSFLLPFHTETRVGSKGHRCLSPPATSVMMRPHRFCHRK